MGCGKQCGTRHGSKHWLNTEPCGLVCGSLTWTLLAWGAWVTNCKIIYPWMGFSVVGVLNMIVFNAFTFMALFSHIRTMTTDPGAVSKHALPLPDDSVEAEFICTGEGPPFKSWCARCQAYKPRRAHHCSMCRRCVIKMDHHCPWVNNCIGIGNHKQFILFVGYIFLSCLHTFILLVGWYAACSYGYVDCKSDGVIPVFLGVESLLFGMFTLCMLGDQATTISVGLTQVDRLKARRENASRSTVMARYGADEELDFNEVFGGTSGSGFQLHWLWPSPVVIPDENTLERVMGCRTSNPRVVLGKDLVDVETGYPEREGSGGVNITSNEGEISPLLRRVGTQLTDDSDAASWLEEGVTTGANRSMPTVNTADSFNLSIGDDDAAPTLRMVTASSSSSGVSSSNTPVVHDAAGEEALLTSKSSSSSVRKRI